MWLMPDATVSRVPLAALSWGALGPALVVGAVAVLLAVHVWAWLRRGPGALAGQRITKAGVAFSLLTLAIAVVALHTKINFLVLLFGMLLSGLLLSFVLSRTTMARLSFERRVPSGVHAGAAFTMELRATNGKRRLSSYGLAVRDVLPAEVAAERPGGVVLALRPGEMAALTYAATAQRRGVWELGSVGFTTRFPFGLFHQGRVRPAPGELVVWPQMGEVAPGWLGRVQAVALSRSQSHAARGEEEFRNLREYRHGDNPRRIHWKTSAKFGQPLVKEMEAVVSERVLVVLDTRAEASGEEALELAVSFAASLARDLMLRGFLVSLAAYAPDLVVTSPTKGSAGFYALLEVLARLEPDPRRSLAELVAEPALRAQDHVLTVAALRHADDDAAAAPFAGAATTSSGA
ncbi:MAG TPA: DUF58 domain-containing protein [Polyangia bacterium]|nr:DUF58 domain-containing protein [Polyangia bacterium]